MDLRQHMTNGRKAPKTNRMCSSDEKKNWDMLVENWKKNCYTQIGEYQDAPAMRTRCSPRGAITLPYLTLNVSIAMKEHWEICFPIEICRKD